MARINVKYPVGSKIKHFSGTDGRITAIFIHGKSRAYEMSYQGPDGKPNSVVVEECEIDGFVENRQLGFGNKNNGQG